MRELNRLAHLAIESNSWIRKLLCDRLSARNCWSHQLIRRKMALMCRKMAFQKREKQYIIADVSYLLYSLTSL